MSALTKSGILTKIPRKKFKLQYNRILYNVHPLNSPNNNNNTINDNNNQKISFYKKVLVKPYAGKKSNNLFKRNINKNNDRIEENNYYSNKNKHNLHEKMNFTNNDILNNTENKIEIDNNEFYLNKTNVEIVMNKIIKEHQPSNITNITNLTNTIDKKRNNKLQKKNIASNDLKETDFLGNDILKNNKRIKDIINDTNNNNDLNLSFFESKRENVNINYINSISNNVYGKINSPIYLNKIYSLTNTTNDNFNIINNETYPLNNKNKQKINKNLKKKILLNDTDLNIDMNKTNEEKQKYDYFSSITDINPISKIEEIELSSFGSNEPKNKKKENLNFLENKKRILSSIEKQKKKLFNENYKNHIKYIKLIQKQQQQYKEYDTYLKKELQKNRNSQIKLLLFKENFFNTLKSNYKHLGIDEFPIELQNLSSSNFSHQIKPKNNLTKNQKFPYKNFNLKLKKINNHVKTENYPPSLKNESSNKIICEAKNRYTARPFNMDKIQIKENELKKRNTINAFIKKSDKLLILINNSFGKNKSNVSHLNLNKKPIISTERSFNYNPDSDIRFSKNTKTMKINVFSEDKNPKTDKRDFDKNNKNLLSVKNTQKSFILKNLVKNIKNEMEKKSQLNKNVNNDTCIKRHLRDNTLKKSEDPKDYYYESNKKNTNLKSKNNKEKEIHEIISKEKKRILNNWSDKKPNNFKMNNALYFSSLKYK